jgi:hypothetical protein
MKNYNRPRKPTQSELMELVETCLDYRCEHGLKDREEGRKYIERVVAQVYIVVIEDYITNSPSYRGKAMKVFWSPYHSHYYSLYVWQNRKIQFLKREDRLRRFDTAA